LIKNSKVFSLSHKEHCELIITKNESVNTSSIPLRGGFPGNTLNAKSTNNSAKQIPTKETIHTIKDVVIHKIRNKVSFIILHQFRIYAIGKHGDNTNNTDNTTNVANHF